MKTTSGKLCLGIAALLVLLASTVAIAAGPAWMPGFPMRMGPNVMLMWAPVPGATGYNVYRSTTQGELGDKLITAPMNNHMDANVPMDKDAVYTIKAVMAGGAEGEPGPSGVLVGVKPLDPPAWAGNMFQAGQLNLRWDGVAGAAFYNVFKAETKGGPFNLVGSVQEPKYVDTAVEEGKTYYYQVSAVDKNNAESPRAEVLEVSIAKSKKRVKAKVYELVTQPLKAGSKWWGSDEAPLKNPIIAEPDPADNGLVYVSNPSGIVLLDSEGETIRSYPAPEGYAARWGQPLFIHLAEDGTLWSTWMNGDFMVRQLDPGNGAVLTEFNIEKPEQVYLDAGRQEDWAKDQGGDVRSFGITTDGQGRLWVADNFFQQILVLETDGTLVKRIGEPRRRSSDLQGMKGLTVLRFNPTNNRVYAADPGSGMVRILDVASQDFPMVDGAPYYGKKVKGSGAGYTTLLKGLAVLGDGNLVLMDGATRSLQVFDPELNYLYTLATKEGQAKIDELASPTHISVLKRTVFVCEVADDRVQTFTF